MPINFFINTRFVFFNNNCCIFPVLSSVRSPFVLRSFSVHSPFVLRSFSVHPPLILRWSSVRSPFVLRSFSVRSPFGLRSFSVRSPFGLRSSSVRAPFVLRSSSVQAPFGNRRLIEDWLKIDRRTNGESSEAKRRSIETLMGNQEKGDPNKNFIFYHLIQIIMARLTPNFITFLHHHIARIENQWVMSKAHWRSREKRWFRGNNNQKFFRKHG